MVHVQPTIVDATVALISTWVNELFPFSNSGKTKSGIRVQYSTYNVWKIEPK